MVIIKQLNIKLLKNNNEILNNNIEYVINDNKIEFILDNMNCYLIIKDNEITFNRENNEYRFNLIIGDNNKSDIYLKEQDVLFDIKVEDGYFTKEDNKIIINYQLETEDVTSTIEVII